jgi:hypothetical protein
MGQAAAEAGGLLREVKRQVGDGSAMPRSVREEQRLHE